MPSSLTKFPVVYRSLEQAVNALKTSEISKTVEVHQLLKMCSSPNSPHSILDPHSYFPKVRPMSVIKPKMPFIVMEGLDGSGKTKVSTALSQQLKLDRIATPPESIKFLKEFFDEQREPIRRIYYSIGNYVAANELSNLQHRKNGIMMDRYWHSTACYAVAQKTTNSDDPNSILPNDWFQWPQDLLKPEFVFFLVVSESIRQERHKTRNTTNTPEEQALATNPKFRESLLDSYRKVQGVQLFEIDANPDVKIITQNVLNLLLDKFPVLRKD